MASDGNYKAEYHVKHFDLFLSNYGDQYLSVKLIRPRDNVKEKVARAMAMYEHLVILL